MEIKKRISEETASEIDASKELEYIIQYCKETSFACSISCWQLLCFWTTYCCHTGSMPDTSEYDETLREIWKAAREGKESLWEKWPSELWKNFWEEDKNPEEDEEYRKNPYHRFDLFMGQFLS